MELPKNENIKKKGNRVFNHRERQANGPPFGMQKPVLLWEMPRIFKRQKQYFEKKKVD